jgi:predicted nucleic acid-binding protein
MILADTSVWVDHLRKGDSIMQRLLQQHRIVIHPFVIGEVALGYLRNRDVILQSLWDIPAVRLSPGGKLWTRDKRLGAAAATLGLEARDELA